MPRKILIAGAIFGMLAVALGAFGAHGLETHTTDEKILHGYQTGTQYQLYHSLALLLTGILLDKYPVKWIRWAGNFFIAGIPLFSGSLYLLTLFKLQGSGATEIVGPVTPIGGLLLILGWLFLLLGVARQGKN